MSDELTVLKKIIKSWIVEERNHIFKYTSPFINSNSSDAKDVFLEYDRATRNARFHNYNISSLSLYDGMELENLPVPTLYDFTIKKLKSHRNQSRKKYAESRIKNSFVCYDEYEDGEICISAIDYSGETDHEVFKAWHMFNHIFELSDQLLECFEDKNYVGVQSYLRLIDDNFSFLMDGKKSYFQLRMDEDELNCWLINEINSFKHLVENKGIWRSLTDNPEKHFQRVFEAALYRVSELYNVDISPEPSTGSGIIDFKFSQGDDAKICVELKLSQNQSVLKGLTLQLEKYKESEKTDKGIYVVLDSGTRNKAFSDLKLYVQDLCNSGLSTEHIIFIDATEKISASKLVQI
ncbi:hypothetical protein [Photobacterium angustum]|uniref:hypothetical protein n=1 Tax=Photobacterium angustum TaxID=661 RepID=UPI0005DF3BD2|nr:hypothetical protein [Photobacterium angustum]KJF92520.1 hypothetical protein UB39_20080 [Photobacterium angustum]PSW77102.1 hypothetical protein CTN03_21025 [Photobacterium angustum]